MTKKLIRMMAWIIIFQLIGYLLGQITQTSIATWYSTLHQSILTPPGFVFAIVWSILYTLIAIAGWHLWENRSLPKGTQALGFFSAQMLLNWAWSPLFFNFHQIALSFYCIIIITLLTYITILLTKDNFKLSSILLTPYLIWLLFASYLNGVIWMLN